jgi:RHS repeat-associated protein
VAAAVSVGLAISLAACSQFISHEAPGMYSSVEEGAGGDFTDSLQTSDPKPYQGSRVAKVDLGADPTSVTRARGVVNLSGSSDYGFYGAALYFPPGTLNGPDPKQQHDLDVVRWDYGDEAEFGGLRIGSDHKARLIRGQAGQPVDTIGNSFSFQEGCWNWVVVEQKLSSDAQQRINKVRLNGVELFSSSDPNWYGHFAQKVRFGAVSVGEGTQAPLDFYFDQSFVSNFPRPDPTDKACDPILGGAEPSTVPMSVQTPLFDATKFLYEGDFPLQQGVAPGTIKEERAAVLHGKVLDRAGQPMESVRVSVPGHPAFGYTDTRSDGKYYMAVNGGGELRVRFERDGFLPIERSLDVDWQQYELTEDVVLTPLDGLTAEIDLTDPGMQVARGNPVSDGDGTRQATLLFPEDTTATMTVGGSSQPVTDPMVVRATEYTVSQTGDEAMPADLPPTSGYTYAVEYSVDEAMEAGATDVTFSGPPVISYTDNFLGFPVGEWIPAGHYDRAKGAWVPAATDETTPGTEDRGRVIKILSENGGVAQLDVDGTGEADQTKLDNQGITLAEREKLAALYDTQQAAKTVWRVPIKHFSAWDYNWPFGPCPTCPPPGQTPRSAFSLDDNCGIPGSSVIECEDQALGERMEIAGSELGLNYRSDRAPGREANNEIEIPLTDDSPHSSLKAVEWQVEIAGQSFTQHFDLPSDPEERKNMSHTFRWDGRDAFGRTLQGAHPARVGIGYIYDGSYQRTTRFGYNGNGTITGSLTRREVTLWSYHTVLVGGWDARGAGLGGWTLDVHHVYDPNAKVLYLGDGTRRSAQDVSRVARKVAGRGTSLDDDVDATEADLAGASGVVAAPDGGYYLSDPGHHKVRKVSPEGTIRTVAGTGTAGYSGDDGPPATFAELRSPQGLDLGPDGSLYIADLNNSRVRRVTPDAKITTAAGGASGLNEGDGGPATQAGVREPLDVAVAADGSFYISTYRQVRRVDPDGIISTVFVSDAAQRGVWGIDLAPDGSLYICDGTTVKRLGQDGRVTRVAGQFDTPGDSGDGGPATQALLRGAGDVAALADGSFYIADRDSHRVRYVATDGTITTAAGNGLGTGGADLSPDGTPGPRALIDGPEGISLGPDGALLVADSGTSRIMAVSAPLPGFSGNDIAIPSEDGSELYRFNRQGRHLSTVNTLTGATVYSFGYEPSGQLESVTDGEDIQNETQIERDGSGNPTAIVAPFGQHTSLALDTDRYLSSLANPENEEYEFTYTEGEGLLSSVTDPRNGTSSYLYDSVGRLEQADDRGDGYKTISRAEVPNGHETIVSTKLGRTTKYRVAEQADGDLLRTHTDPAGLQSTLEVRQDGSRKATSVDDTVTTTQRAPDPRFEMQASTLQDLVLETPDGRTLDLDGSRQVTLGTPGDPLSLQTLTDTLNVNGHQYTTAYDASQDRFTTTTPQNRSSTTAIDHQGRPTRSESPELHPVTTTYLGDGRLETEKQGPDNDPTKQRIWQYTYESPSGFLDTVTDPLNRATTFDYDLAGRITKQVLPGNREILFGYDPNGNLSSVTPPSRPAHVFDHNAVDLVKTYDPPNVGFAPTTTYEYNEDQDLERILRPDGREISFTFEQTERRLDYFTQPSGQTDIDYDPATGNVATITAPGPESLSLTYDGSLPKRETYTGTVDGSASRTYDNDLRIASTSVNDAYTANYSYDADSLLEQAGDLDLHRDPESGLLTGSTLGSTETTVVPNGFGEPDSISGRFGTQTLYSATFQRDNLGRIEQKTETTSQGTQVYVYDYFDDTGFLRSVMRGGQPVAEYTYDANGNRKTGPGVTTPAEYDDQDRLESYGEATYTYNNSGELETKTVGQQVTQYGYDALGVLQNATLPDGTLIDYITDGDGRRIAKKVGSSVVQRFVYGEEALGPVADLNSDGTVRSRFVYATRSTVPDYMVRNGTKYRFVLDHLGSPRTIVDSATGEVAQEIDYDEYGNVIRDTQPGFQPFGFAGGLYDTDTGLVLFGARDYDPSTGRWTAKDPIGFAGGDTNLYGYVLDDPLNLTDPEGESLISAAKEVGMDVSNAAAGALSSYTGGLSNRIAGVDGTCAGPGYGFGETLGSLNPRSAGSSLIRGGVKRFARQKGRTRGGGQRLGHGDDPLYKQGSDKLKEKLRNPAVSKAEKQKIKQILKGRKDRPSSETR